MKILCCLALIAPIYIVLSYAPTRSPGCHPLWAQTADDSKSQLLKIGTSHNGVREYILDLPSTWKAEKPAPLILAFHGKNQASADFKQQTQLSEVEFNPNALVAYPKGIDKQWTGDPTAPKQKEINDVEFAGHLIDHITQMYCIDMRRIYAVGFSNGGGLAQLLACDKKVSQRLAAVAIASGAFYFDDAIKDALFGHCTPGRSPMPIMEFHGDNDPIIDYEGKRTPDGRTYSIAHWGSAWAERNGCPPDPFSENTLLYDGQVRKFAWRCGSWKETAVHYLIHGFGHGWPSTKKQQDDDFQRHGPAPFDATRIIMEFFDDHMLPENAKAFKDEL